MPPCLIFEDEHLLVVNKPAGLNTHAPSLFAGEGLYDWLRHREPRWARLAIIHRLDKETSGVMVFSKTQLANRALTEQFTQRLVKKAYVLLTDRPVPPDQLVVKSTLVRAGSKYVSYPVHAAGELAETLFRAVAVKEVSGDGAGSKDQRLEVGRGRTEPAWQAVAAVPLTGRTHQIRVHAAQSGFPILGDTLYGGTPAARVCLHACQLTLSHPASGREMTWLAPADFGTEARGLLRSGLIEPELTNAYRLVHGASDGWPGWYVDRLGDYLLSQAAQPLRADQMQELERLARAFSARAAYHKLLTRQVRRANTAEAAPQRVLGEPAPDRFTIQENGVPFALSLAEGYSVGLFLDQRDNRRRLLTGHVAADFPLLRPGPAGQPAAFRVLNTFAYTCGFSVCAAKAGARTTSLDLSRKYIEWGKGNFGLYMECGGKRSATPLWLKTATPLQPRADHASESGVALRLPPHSITEPAGQAKDLAGSPAPQPAGHEFMAGDAFDWVRRLAKRQRLFEVILLDPPTFSQSKVSGVFRAEKDYGKLVLAALPLLIPGGVLFASSNAAGWAPEAFLAVVKAAIHSTGRRIVQEHYVPQPPDFPISRAEPAYLKTVWLRVE